jgi:hypothetical protein
LRYLNKTLKRENEELLEQVEDLRRSLRRVQQQPSSSSASAQGSERETNGSAHHQSQHQHQSLPFGYIDFSQLVGSHYSGGNKENQIHSLNASQTFGPVPVPVGGEGWWMPSQSSTPASASASTRLPQAQAHTPLVYLQDQLNQMKQQLTSSLDHSSSSSSRGRPSQSFALPAQRSLATSLDASNDLTYRTGEMSISHGQVSDAIADVSLLDLSQPTRGASDREYEQVRSQQQLSRRLHPFPSSSSSSSSTSLGYSSSRGADGGRARVSFSHGEPFRSPAMKLDGGGGSVNDSLSLSLSVPRHPPSSQSKSGVADRDELSAFEGISDGGYYEGYWKAKYLPKSKA